VRTFTAQSPPEPAVGSVVLDPDGVAWQRQEGDSDQPSIWMAAQAVLISLFGSRGGSPWPMLLITKRELRLIYDADLTVQMPDLVAQLDDPPPR